MSRSSPEERAALKEEAEMRKTMKAERAERIKAHVAKNPDMSFNDVARAFNVRPDIVHTAMGRRRKQ